mmetsp:Transcript_32070/g.68331  ORF Transcript_32070/g.68331 Transcript_32070/m.68331 type:complete len:207 (-) Transcript_32070:548-1168(-)
MVGGCAEPRQEFVARVCEGREGSPHQFTAAAEVEPRKPGHGFCGHDKVPRCEHELVGRQSWHCRRQGEEGWRRRGGRRGRWRRRCRSGRGSGGGGSTEGTLGGGGGVPGTDGFAPGRDGGSIAEVAREGRARESLGRGGLARNGGAVASCGEAGQGVEEAIVGIGEVAEGQRLGQGARGVHGGVWAERILAVCRLGVREALSGCIG